MNNYEKIKAMSIDEMAEKIWTYTAWSCDFCAGADCPDAEDEVPPKDFCLHYIKPEKDYTPKSQTVSC